MNFLSEVQNLKAGCYLDGERVDKNKHKEIKAWLVSVKAEDLLTIEDHKVFIEILSDYRQSTYDEFEAIGEGFKEFIKSTLSVGEDGLYTNELRFLFELIQNVDDCTFPLDNDRRLDIHFSCNEGKIELFYNENGFEPFNVFAVTGIAERAKNISPDKIEIGEKGIGFKSVFGIASKVLVQSGKFSFMLDEDSFVVPVPSYANFNGVKGTKLTLFVKSINGASSEAVCSRIFNEIINKYCSDDALFNNNPILFLNKLTNIKLYFDGYDCIEFSVSRDKSKEENIGGGNYRETDVSIESVLSSRRKKLEKQKRQIKCVMYSRKICYDHLAYQSRYGDGTKLTDREQYIRVMVPTPEFAPLIGKGRLYSFLPTQVKMSVPIICHVPFKLDGSREYVDSQNQNRWFILSCEGLSGLLNSVFIDLAKIDKNKALLFIPKKGKYCFEIETSNIKLVCFQREEFSGNKFLSLPVFYTANDKFVAGNEVYFLPGYIKLNDIEKAKFGELLNYHKELFLPPEGVSATDYGIEMVNEPCSILFNKALKDISIIKSALDMLDVLDAADSKAEQTQYVYLIKNISRDMQIPLENITEISRHKHCAEEFNKAAIAEIRQKRFPKIKVAGVFETTDIRNIVSADDPIDYEDLNKLICEYLKTTGFVEIPLSNELPFFIAHNVLVLCQGDRLASFAQMCAEVDKKDVFAANMHIRAASKRLDRAEGMTASEYLKLLHEVRASIKNALGIETYRKYIDVIKKLNADPKRFLNELLQNADDLNYSKDEPFFKFNIVNGILRTECNEDGFENKNVRAITAIGESTKRKLLKSEFGFEEIGEKGIGFKTVFSVAKSVDIHSKDFHFNLNGDTPTIPKEIKPLKDNNSGTVMLFELNNPEQFKFESNEVVELCLCLHKLKRIYINEIEIKIEDEGNKRTISCNGQKYVFYKFTHDFEINDDEAIKERSGGDKQISNNQKINYYIAAKKIPEKINWHLYACLPTSIKVIAPIAIDAPFELDSARNYVIDNLWNRIVRTKLYEGYFTLLKEMSRKYRIKVLTYIRFNQSAPGIKSEFKLIDCEFFNQRNIIEKIRELDILPTLDKECFVTPSTKEAFYYPAAVYKLLGDCSDSNIIENSTEQYESILKNLGCHIADNYKIAKLIINEVDKYINEEDFRHKLYKYLFEVATLNSVAYMLRSAPIIPIAGEYPGSIRYIAYNDGEIYAKDNTDKVYEGYNVITEDEYINRQDIERLLGVQIQILNDDLIKHKYSDELKDWVLSDIEDGDLYYLLLNEFNTKQDLFHECGGILVQYNDKIPFLMRNGKFKHGLIFLADNNVQFNGSLLKAFVVDVKANALAAFLKCRDIKDITYDNLCTEELSELTDDDIEDIKQLSNSSSILERFIFDGLISNELVAKYNLYWVRKTDYSQDFDESYFPNEPIENLDELEKGMQKDLSSVREIQYVRKEINVQKICQPNGKLLSLDDNEIREDAMGHYHPANNIDLCYCQMCKSVKPKEYIQVNNIKLKPKYYWRYTRIVLCLECSKHFELMRNNIDLMNKFEQNILDADAMSNQAIGISIGNEKIYFTQTHLAKLQLILKANKI